MKQFGSWFELTEASIDANAPDGPAALQVRRASGLVDYPTGKSAMVWYGYANTSARSVLRTVFVEEVQAMGDEPQREFRFMEGDGARDAIETVWVKFQRRFGSPPVLNQQ